MNRRWHHGLWSVGPGVASRQQRLAVEATAHPTSVDGAASPRPEVDPNGPHECPVAIGLPCTVLARAARFATCRRDESRAPCRSGRPPSGAVAAWRSCISIAVMKDGGRRPRKVDIVPDVEPFSTTQCRCRSGEPRRQQGRLRQSDVGALVFRLGTRGVRRNPRDAGQGGPSQVGQGSLPFG